MSTLKTHKCITVLSLRKFMLVKGYTRRQVKHKNQAILIHGEQANINRLSIKCTERHQRAEENVHRDE